MIRLSNRFFLPPGYAYATPGRLLLPLLLTPIAVAAQSPELVQAIARLVERNKELDGTIAGSWRRLSWGRWTPTPRGSSRPPAVPK